MNDTDHTIVRNGLLLDPETERAEVRDVLIAGDCIAEIGPPGLAAPQSAREIDAADMLVIPGLINAHTHGHGSLGKGMGDRWTLELLLNAGPWISGQRTLEDKYLAAHLNGVEMALKGCTAAYDMYFEFPVPTAEGMNAVAQGYADAGVRVVLAPMMADLSLYDAIPGLLDHLPEALRREAEKFRLRPYEESITAARTFLHDWRHDPDNARPALAPTIPLHCSDPFLAGCRDLVSEFGVSVQMHLAESRTQAVSAMRRYGRTLTAHMDELGLLGPGFVGGHCIWVDDDDLKRLADNGSSISHNPGSNLKLGTGIAPVRRMLDAGVPVGVGTDGTNSSDSQNMFDAIRFAAYVSRVNTFDYQGWISAAEALRMATTGSARVLGMSDRIGRLAPGYKADMVMLDLGNVNYIPFNNPLHQIVACEDSSAVQTVMVGGEIIVDGGHHTRVELFALRSDIENAMDRLRAATADQQRLAKALEDLVGGYCVGLACSDYHVHRTVQLASQ